VVRPVKSRFVDNTPASQAYKGTRRSKLAELKGNDVLSLSDQDGTVSNIDPNLRWDLGRLAPNSTIDAQELDRRVARVCARRNQGHGSKLPYSRGGLNRGGGDTGLFKIAKNMGLPVGTHHKYKALVNGVCAVRGGGRTTFEEAEKARKEQSLRYAQNPQWSKLHREFTAAKAAATAARGKMIKAEVALKKQEDIIDYPTTSLPQFPNSAISLNPIRDSYNEIKMDLDNQFRMLDNPNNPQINPDDLDSDALLNPNNPPVNPDNPQINPNNPQINPDDLDFDQLTDMLNTIDIEK
jgi:hypothetical protein